MDKMKKYFVINRTTGAEKGTWIPEDTRVGDIVGIGNMVFLQLDRETANGFVASSMFNFCSCIYELIKGDE